jgi:hypothetical protein
MDFLSLRDEVIDDLDAGISVQLASAPGLGKSEFVHQLVDYLSKRDGEEWGFATMFLATQTPPDLIGYQFKGERTWNGKNVAVTEPTLPLWMVTQSGKPTWAYKRGILFLDEYGQGEADVKRASAELLLNKQIGPWKLGGENHAGWGVIAASNRADDRSGVTKEFDFVINRRGQYNITASVDAWTDWAVANSISPLTIAFANQNPHIVFDAKVPDKQGPWCTPRSLVMLDRKMQVKFNRTGRFPDDPHTLEGAQGLIGAGAAQYFAFVRLEREMPKFEAIIANPTKEKVPEKPDAQMLVVYNLAHRVDTQNIEHVIKYVERMPKEFSITFAKAACKRDQKILVTPAMRKWSTENSSLMAAIGR